MPQKLSDLYTDLLFEMAQAMEEKDQAQAHARLEAISTRLIKLNFALYLESKGDDASAQKMLEGMNG